LGNQSTSADSALLSILIPTYKRPELLGIALESVVAQTRHADEVIVVDNDPAESASDTVKSFHGRVPNLKYIPSSTKQGASYSMNIAAQAATGEWLVYLDDDDYWDSKYLAAVEQAIDLSVSECIITWIAYDFDGVVSGGKKMPRDITIEKILRDGNPGFVGSSIAIKKSLYEHLDGFDESMPSSQDIDFLIRMIESEAKYHVIEEELTFLRNHSGTRLTDLASGHRATGTGILLAKHGHKVSRATRRRINGRMHANASAATGNPISRWRHAILATLYGNRSVTRAILKRPW
jgi:glycosyltransferase involved in cell wall biosynthesis